MRVIVLLLSYVLFFWPWITHIVWCIRAADETGSAIALLLVGIVVPPVGWIHGIALLLGYTWI